MADLVNDTRKGVNKGIKAHLLLSSVPLTMNVTGFRKALTRDYPEFSLLQGMTRDREVYRSTVVDGSGVWDWTGTSEFKSAQNEIANIAKEINNGAKSKAKANRSKARTKSADINP